MKNMEENYLRAKEQVKKIKDFYTHLFTYILVISFLAGVNYYSNQWVYPWFLWALGGWGIGIVFDGLQAFQINPLFNKKWEEDKIKALMEEEQNQKWE
jgi:hypothetical protein